MERLQKCVQVDGEYVGWAKRTQYIEIDFHREIRLCYPWHGTAYNYLSQYCRAVICSPGGIPQSFPPIFENRKRFGCWESVPNRNGAPFLQITICECAFHCFLSRINPIHSERWVRSPAVHSKLGWNLKEFCKDVPHILLIQWILWMDSKWWSEWKYDDDHYLRSYPQLLCDLSGFGIDLFFRVMGQCISSSPESSSWHAVNSIFSDDIQFHLTVWSEFSLVYFA
jgi:hypothetical protein